MNESIHLQDIVPTAQEILQNQGYQPGSETADKVTALVNKAMDIFRQSASPRGIICGISADEFEKVYQGENNNEFDNPLLHIYSQADHLALFALTLGGEISAQVEALFQKSDYAVAHLLDTIASLTAENAVEAYQQKYMDSLAVNNYDSAENYVMAYSPGYCGWHVSGQKKLFEVLHPEKIGITLNGSFLMQPIKSVSGVLVAGKKKIHIFPISFYFCKDCRTKTCRQRIKSMAVG